MQFIVSYMQIQKGAVWNNTVTSAGRWLNRTVTVMHHDATCRVYSCYSQDDCYYYSIAMVNAECNFQLGKMHESSIII